MPESQKNTREKTNNFWGLSLKKTLQLYPFARYLKKYQKLYLKGLLWLVFVDLINVIQPLLVKEAVDALIPRDLNRVWWAAGLFTFVMCLQSVGRYWWRIYLIGTANHVSADLRRELYRHLQSLPLKRYQSIRTGDLMSRATNDVESIRMALGPGILVAADAIVLFLLLVPAMFWLSWKLTLLAFAFYPLVPWITAKIGDKIDTFSEKVQSRLSQMSAFAQEIFSGIRLIKSLTLENRSLERFRTLSESYVRDGNTLTRYEAVFSPSLGLLTNLGTLLILLFGGFDVLNGALTVGTFIAFQRFVVQLSWPMEAIGWSVTMTREAKAAERRLQEIFSSKKAKSRYEESAHSNKQFLMEIQNLTFRFEDKSEGFRLKLDGLNILPGQKVGLVGPVGAGKTTLFQLLLRLYEPPPGSIFFKGKDTRTIASAELRKEIASVEQQVHLFSETMHTNVVMGLEISPSKIEIERAVAAASLLSEIESLEQGFETVLGEKGINLSGGQKQRLALVRALVRKPELLLLDDCFSAVDVEKEQEIITGLFHEYPGLTLLFASHRLSIMAQMDEVWLIDKGSLVARGKHPELLKTSQLYRELWQKSKKEEMREHFEGVSEGAPA